MWTTIKTMLTSKKALMALVAALVWIAGKAGLKLDNTELLGAVTPLWAFIIAQGVADHGKETAKALAAPVPVSVNTAPRVESGTILVEPPKEA